MGREEGIRGRGAREHYLNKAGSIAIGFFWSACTLFTVQVAAVGMMVSNGMKLARNTLEIRAAEKELARPSD